MARPHIAPGLAAAARRPGHRRGTRWACAVALVLACQDLAPRVDPRDEAEGYYLQGQRALLDRELPRARESFQRVKALIPGDPRLPVAEGELALAEGKLDEAVAAFEAASRADPRRPAPWSRLAVLYRIQGKPGQAEAAARAALERHPEDFDAMEVLADVRVGQGDVDGGVGWYARAARSAPGVHRPALVMKAVKELEGSGRDAEATALLDGLSREPEPSAALFAELGERLVRAGRLADAVNVYAQAAQADPADRGLLEVEGELELKLGWLEAAEATFRRALAVKDGAVIHAALARVCQARGDRPCVAAELERALATATGEEPREALELAELLAAVGRTRDALALLRTLAEEPEQATNVHVQLKTAQVARLARDEALVKEACRRAMRAADPPSRCP